MYDESIVHKTVPVNDILYDLFLFRSLLSLSSLYIDINDFQYLISCRWRMKSLFKKNKQYIEWYREVNAREMIYKKMILI